MRNWNGWILQRTTIIESRKRTEDKPAHMQRQRSVFNSSLMTKAPTCTGAPDTVNAAVQFRQH